MFKAVLKLSVSLWSSLALTQEIYQVNQRTTSSYEALVSSLTPGTVLVLGEVHDHVGHHASHVQILNELIAQGWSFDVGLEFFEYPNQIQVEQYLFGELEEADFLKLISWGGFPFEWYRPKVLAPLETGGLAYALNAPRAVTRAIARDGLAALTPELQKLMPPDLELGDAEYFERFRQAVGGDHVPPESLEKYFAAQSTWDETMAWKTLQNFSSSRQNVFVVIVGDFHVAYGGGLPDRLRARGAERVVTVSHVDSTGLSQTDKLNTLEPHPDWGSIADWVVFAKRPEQAP